MKEKTPNDFKSLYNQICRWLRLEVSYVKLTAAEKLSILFSAFAICAVFMLAGLVVLILLAFSLVDVFKMLFSPWLACLCVSGIIILLMALVVVFKNILIVNPISRFISRLILDRENNDVK